MNRDVTRCTQDTPEVLMVSLDVLNTRHYTG